jgi:hypothetical protein
MSSDLVFLERDATAEDAASAPAGETWIAQPDVAATPAHANEDDFEDDPIAAGPADGPFAEGLWLSLRWWVHQLMVVFNHPEDLQGKQLDRRGVRLMARWLRGIEGLARKLLIVAAASFEIGDLPALRSRTHGQPKATVTADGAVASRDGKRRCSFRALDWGSVCGRTRPQKPGPLAAPPAPEAPPVPRRIGKRKSRYHPDYNPHYRGEFDPPPPPRLPQPSRAGQKRPKKIDDNPWKIFPPDPPPPDDGKRWPGLPYARRIEALRWLVYEPEKAVRRLAIRIARRRDGWEQLALIRQPARGKIAPPAWTHWFDAHLDAKDASMERWKQAHALADTS